MRTLLSFVLLVSMMLIPLTATADLGNNPPHPVIEPASIVSVSLSSSSHLVGFAAQLQVALGTANVPDGTSALFRLVSAGSPALPVDGVERSGTINNNHLIVTLSLPESLSSGSYRVEVSLASLGLSDSGVSYLVRQDASPAIIGASVNPASITAGQETAADVSVATFSIDDGTSVVAVFLDPLGLPVPGVSGQGVVVGNSATIMLLIPDTLTPGAYTVETTIETLRDLSGTFTVLPEGQSNLPPVASSLTVLGTPQVGNTLSGLYLYSDAENDPQGASLLRWLRADAVNGSRSHVGNGATYQLTSADVGKYLWFEVTPRATAGQVEGMPVLSSPVGPVQPTPTGGGTGGSGGGVFIPPTPLPATPPITQPEPGESDPESGTDGVAIVDTIIEVDEQTGRRNLVYSATDDLMDQIADVLASGTREVTLTIESEVPTDPSTSIVVRVSPSIIQQIAETDGASLVVETPFGAVKIPADVLGELASSEAGADFTLRWGDGEDVSALMPVSMAPVNPPLWVESGLVGTMEVSMSLDIPLPEDEELRSRYLEQLRIFVVHNDGEQRLIPLSRFIVDSEESPATLRSLTFTVEKFSSFTLVELTAEPLVTVIGSRGYSVGGRFVDMPPCYYRGNDTMMPVRMLEEFGVSFDWDQSTGTATLSFLSRVVRLTIGSATAEINGLPVPIIGASGRAIAPELAPGRTMIPLRFVSERLLFDVHWDVSNTVTVSMK